MLISVRLILIEGRVIDSLTILDLGVIVRYLRIVLLRNCRILRPSSRIECRGSRVRCRGIQIGYQESKI